MSSYKRLGDCTSNDIVLVNDNIRTKDEILSDADYAALGETKDRDLRKERERQAADNRSSYDWALRSDSSSGTDFSSRFDYCRMRRTGRL